MEKVYGVHWTTGFNTPEISLFKDLEKAKEYKKMILSAPYNMNHFVPIEVILDENRLLKVIKNNIGFEAANCEFSWQPLEPEFSDHFDSSVYYYISSKQMGYELLEKHLDKKYIVSGEDRYEPGEIETEFDNLDAAQTYAGRIIDDGGFAEITDEKGHDYPI